MKRIWLLASLVILLAVVGVVLAQEGPDASFVPQVEIGQPRPRGVLYDPNFDQLVWVDALGRLVLVDAATLQEKHVLYTQGTYSVYQFSHDGRWLALGIDRRVELWDTQSGALIATAAPEEAVRMQAPLQFADDDKLLLITAVVPAPAALRRSENDTSLLPFLWDLPAARDEAPSTLPRRFELYAFYDYRNGFVLGPHDRVVAALPSRLQVIDAGNTALPVLAEIPSTRAERDPISVWYSLRGEYMYVLPQGSNNFFQVNTAAGTTFEIPLGRDLGYRDIRALDGLGFSAQARIVGTPNSREDNTLLRLLLGANYRAYYDYHPLTVTLLDLVDPITVDDRRIGFLVYVFDEQTGRGMIEALRLEDVQDMALHPDNRHLAVRRASGDQAVEVYDLATGLLATRLVPAVPDPDGSQLLAYDRTGEALLVGFQRFDAASGAVLHEDLSYVPGFDQVFFTPDSQQLVTLTGTDWWLWDLATAQVIRRERANLRGTLLQTSPDGFRFMTQLDLPEGRGIEVLDMGTGERHSVLFETPGGQLPFDVIPSPDWAHFLVTYEANPYSPYYPGQDLAIYGLRDGLRWFIAGDDLPAAANRSFGWLDDATAYIYGEGSPEAASGERVYGVEYAPSGLPACLVEAFPDTWPRWSDLWQTLSLTLRPARLDALAQRLCEAAPETVAEVEAVFHPTPTPTLLPVTATPAVIAGVPACLTARFPREATEYAQIWREMSAGLDPEQTRTLETLLCEGLVNASSTSSDSSAPGEDRVRVMTIDVDSGERFTGSYLPPRQAAPPRDLNLIAQEFELATNRFLRDPLLSPDGARLADRTASNHVVIYRLPVSYPTLAAAATATAAGIEGVRYLSVQPTATQPFARDGQPRPTQTPTITPTGPARPDQPANLPRRGEVEDVCPSDAFTEVSTTPTPGDLPSGELLVRLNGDSPFRWRLNAATGALRPDDTLPTCLADGSCVFSFDRAWIGWQRGGDTFIARPDGSDARRLADIHGSPLAAVSNTWLGAHTLAYSYDAYQLELSPDPVRLLRRYDPETGTLSEPFRPPEAVRILDVGVQVVAEQPDGGPLLVAALRFNTGVNDGYLYYLVNRDTGTADYFARLAEYPDNALQATWHPLGDTLYLRYPDGETAVYLPAEDAYHTLDRFPSGLWSPDGHATADWFLLPADERQALLDAGQPLPRLAVWDRASGLVRRYCIPGTDEAEFAGMVLTWSPDSRYLAFQARLPADGSDDTVRPRTLVLDTLTGRVASLSIDVDAILAWVE